MRRVALGGVAFSVVDDEGAFWDRVESGAWEPETLALLRERLAPGIDFLDLGAWVGPLSLYGAALGARVVAVEADPSALADLRANVAVNPGLAARIEIVAAAAAIEPGTVRLGARRKSGDSMSSVLLADAGTSWTAPVVTPAQLASRFRRPLVVKIDIEGAEFGLLPGLGPLLAIRPLACLVAFHPGLLGERDPGERARLAEAALAPFATFRAEAVGAAVPIPDRPDATSLARHDLWLFEAP